MSKLRTLLVIAVVVAGTIIVMRLQQQKLLDEVQALRRQNEQLADVEKTNSQLTQLLAQSQSADSKTTEQLSELLKLRSEVNGLRRASNELASAKEENQRLKTSLAQASHSIAQSPDDAVRRESWSFAGYGSPDSAFLSTIWAMSQGNVKMVLSSLVPDSPDFKEMSQEAEEEVAKKTKSEFDKVTSFKIINRENVSNDEVILTTYAEGINESARIRLMRSGNEWKVFGAVKDK